MSTDNGVPPPIPERTRRHRLTDRDQLTAQLVKQYDDPAVATYTLAVRDLAEKHPDIGPVDTWFKVVQKIMRDRERGQGDKPSRKPPLDKTEQGKLRKKLSWHFSVASRGPAWQVVEILVRHLVQEKAKANTFASLKDLHKAARGVYPDNELTDAGAAEGGVTATAEGGQIEALRQRIAYLEGELTASQKENDRLRTELGRLTGRSDPAPDDPPRQGALGMVPSPRAGQGQRFHPDRSPQIDLMTPHRSGTGAAATIYWIDMFQHDPSPITATPAQRSSPSSGATGRFAALITPQGQLG